MLKGGGGGLKIDTGEKRIRETQKQGKRHFLGYKLNKISVYALKKLFQM